MSTVHPVMNFSGASGTLAPPQGGVSMDSLQVFNLASTGAGPSTLEFEETDRGTYLYSGLSIFRSGTFRDSWGDQTTWEPEHIEQMSFHFNLLKGRGIFPNPVVRHNHPSIFGGGGEVVGYITDLRRESRDGVDFLVADFEITEPDAHGRIQRGTYRARSAEVGYYVTNDEAMFWPVLKGFAFVDIPAVEGLFQKGDYAVLRKNKEQTVSKEDKKTEGGGPSAAQQLQSSSSGFQWSGGEGAHKTNGGGNEGGSPSTGQQGEGGAPPPTTHSFRIGGESVQDFARVQQYIDNLESENATLRQAQDEQREQARKDFVNGLARDGKILATQVENFQNMVVSMTDEQFGMFQESYKDAPAMGTLMPQGTSSGGGPPEAGGPKDQGNQFSDLDNAKEIVERHRLSGMSPDKIKETRSYKKLEAAGQAPELD